MNNLTERYIYAVTRLLPQSQRKDVADELRTTIEDMAADHSKHGKPTEADVKAVLTELGDPAVFAAKYNATPRYLVGPMWYSHYISLLKTLLSIVPAIIGALTLAADLAQGSPVPQAAVHAVGAGIGVGIQIAFWITIVFVALERAASSQRITLTKTWSPDQLPQVPKHPARQIGVVESATSAGLIALGTAWFALSPIIQAKDGVPLFNPQLGEFWAPVFFVLAGLALVHKLWQLKIGKWTTPLMLTNIALGTAGIVYILALISTQQIINLEYFHAWGATTSTEDLAGMVHWATSITAAACIATFVWDGVQSVVLNRRLAKK